MHGLPLFVAVRIEHGRIALLGMTFMAIEDRLHLTFAAYWGHARRKVVESTTYQAERDRLLAMIQAVYDVETRAVELTWQDR